MTLDLFLPDQLLHFLPYFVAPGGDPCHRGRRREQFEEGSVALLVRVLMGPADPSA